MIRAQLNPGRPAALRWPLAPKMTMADEQEKLAVLKRRADKVGYQVEPSVKKLGYCLWQSWPGGRHMILGRNDNDGVTLDAIARKLDEVEVEEKVKMASVMVADAATEGTSPVVHSARKRKANVP